MFRVELVRAWVGFGVGWIGLGFEEFLGYNCQARFLKMVDSFCT